MKLTSKSSGEKDRRDFPVFKGYSVSSKSEKTSLNEQFIVPWEISDQAQRNKIS